MELDIRYARSGDVNVAYQVVGEGALDIVFVMGWVSHIAYFWEEPRFARFLRRLASFARLILFDKRGTGLSDRVTALPTLEERMDDVRAVMDAAGSRRAALVGVSEGGPMCTLFAATYPERTVALVILGGFARRLWASDYPWAETREEWQAFLASIEREWGVDFRLAQRAPSAMADERFRRWWSTYLRMSASPGAAVAFTRMNGEIDIRPVLPAVTVPTLVIHRTGDRAVQVGNGRYLGAHIPGARFVELPGEDHLPFVGDQDEILDEIERFLTGVQPAERAGRILASLLFAEFLAAPDGARLTDAQEAAARELARFQGRRLRETPNGFLASFDGPARAIRYASAIGDEVRRFGLDFRAAVHTGECEIAGEEVQGPTVALAARMLSRAAPAAIVVSRTVKDLVVGSGIQFDDCGTDEEWPERGGMRLFRVERPEAHGTSGAPASGGAPRPAGDPLSPREREVAGLVACGLTNRQIAEEFGVSPATVERHVTNILNKLGYRSRAQIAVWAGTHGLVPSPVADRRAES